MGRMICPNCETKTKEKYCPKCGWPTVDEESLRGGDLVGKVIDGKYEVLSLIGKGGMGHVYKARNRTTDAVVALKVLPREAASDLPAVQRFMREARATSRLMHPNTIRVYDFGQSQQGFFYIVMEYLKGRSLAQELRQKQRLPEARALNIAKQVLMSLGEAHSQNPPIIHRDIKPSNIFLVEAKGHEDFVKVLDFGIAKVVGEDAITRTQQAVGTPTYWSPEQALGREVDGRSDLYSLGIVMYEMVCGAPPFRDKTPMRLQLKHVHEPVPPIRERFPDISSEYESFVLTLLQKDPNQRPRDAEDALARITAMEMLRRPTQVTVAPPQPVQPNRPSATLVDVRPPVSEAPSESRVQFPNKTDTTTCPLPSEEEGPTVPLGEWPQGEGDKVEEAKPTTPLAGVAEDEEKKEKETEVIPAEEGPRPRRVPVFFLLTIGVVVISFGLFLWLSSGPKEAGPSALQGASQEAKGVSVSETRDASPDTERPAALATVPENLSPPKVPDDMVYVPPGEYPVGCTEGATGCEEDERPGRRVKMEGFFIDKYEVSVAEYRKCVEAGQCPTPMTSSDCPYGKAGFDSYPVTCVTWEGARKYCDYVHKRLPTEAEWEVAARGPKGFDWPSGNERPTTCDKAVMRSCREVASRTETNDKAWCGAFHLAGNVREWVFDDYGPYPSGRQNPGISGKVNRGGSYLIDRENFPTAHGRNADDPHTARPDLGFRCAKGVSAEGRDESRGGKDVNAASQVLAVKVRVGEAPKGGVEGGNAQGAAQDKLYAEIRSKIEAQDLAGAEASLRRCGKGEECGELWRLLGNKYQGSGNLWEACQAWKKALSLVRKSDVRQRIEKKMSALNCRTPR